MLSEVRCATCDTKDWVEHPNKWSCLYCFAKRYPEHTLLSCVKCGRKAVTRDSTQINEEFCCDRCRKIPDTPNPYCKICGKEKKPTKFQVMMKKLDNQYVLIGVVHRLANMMVMMI